MKLQSILQVSFGMVLSAILIVLIKQIQNVERKLNDINNNYATLSTNINSGLTNINSSISNLTSSMTLMSASAHQSRIHLFETVNSRLARSYEILTPPVE